MAIFDCTAVLFLARLTHGRNVRLLTGVVEVSRMKHIRMSEAIYQERAALVARIKHLEASARHFKEDWRATMVDAAEYIACARTRLAHIDTMIKTFTSNVDV